MDLPWYKCNIHYYLREKYYGTAKNLSKEALLKYPSNVEFIFYHGLCNILEGQTYQVADDLSVLQTNKDFQLAITIALIYGYKNSSNADKEMIYNLESKLREERKQGSAFSYYLSGFFLSLTDKKEKAMDYINKSLKKDPHNPDTIILKAWNDMKMLNELSPSILKSLESILNTSDSMNALLAKARFHYLVKDYQSSNLTLDKLIITYPDQVVPLVEKLKNEFSAQKWEAISDMIERILSKEPSNIQAWKAKIYLSLCKDYDHIEAADQLNKLYNLLENQETNNGYQFLYTAQLYSRACSKSSAVLLQAYRFAQYASEMYPNNVIYLSEIGYQCVLQGKYKEAVNFFKSASKIDSNSVTALCGLTLCLMLENGPTEQTSQQVELLFEMQGTSKHSILFLLSAQLNSKNSDKAISLLNEAYMTNLLLAKRNPISLEYIRDLDPELMLEIFKEYRRHLPKKPFVIIDHTLYTKDRSPAIENCLAILNSILEPCPGLVCVLYEKAKLMFLYGDSEEATKLALETLDLDNTHAGIQILLTQICILKMDYKKAAHYLESCFSYNFKIRDSSMYHFLNGVILKNNKLYKEALASYMTSLQNAMSKSTSNRMYEIDLNIVDKATLYLEVIELQTLLELHGDAGKTMQDAIQDLTYTSEESRLIIARANLSLIKGDIDSCLELLNSVKPNQPYYIQAHTKMANIYLKEKRDKNMFTTCLRDIVANDPMTEAHSMMGDSYMSIDEPKQAAEAYEAAVNNNPKDLELIKKLGGAYFKMHEYDKACAHYERYAKMLDCAQLKFEQLELLIKLKQYDKVDSAISQELKSLSIQDDIDSMKKCVHYLLLQVKARELKNPTSPNINGLLIQAKDLQTTIVRRVEIDNRGKAEEEKSKLSVILCSLAKVKGVKEPIVAINLYSESLMYKPRDPNTLVALARLYSSVGNSEKCEQTCGIVLSADPNNEAAAVMMADIAFRKLELESAARHLSQVLRVKPQSWSALAQLIEVQWRRGALADAEPALQAAKEGADDDDAEYSYCAGVYAAHSGRHNFALRSLNAARRGPNAAAAAFRMAMLCLSQHAAGAAEDDVARSAEDVDTKMLALRTAEKLVAEVDPQQRKALQALLQLATGSRSSADRVLQDLSTVADDSSNQSDPYLILAIAKAYNILKQPARAKNILKRAVPLIPWSPENADGLERCWLEMAEHQIASGKLDSAKDLLERVLQHNKSCALAYLHLGQIAEKEQNYTAAALNYDCSWVHSFKTDFSVGYKLAYSYLKLKKYPDCIIVCRSILKVHPDYPKIRRDVLEKARTNLRT